MTERGYSLTIYYSVENMGDGSAVPRFFTTKELADYHQEHQYEGWGEPCVGEIVIHGSDMTCPEALTKEAYYLGLLEDSWGDEDSLRLEEFVEDFFPKGVPDFSVKVVGKNHYGIYLGDKLVHQWWAHPEKKANAAGARRLAEFIRLGKVGGSGEGV